MSRERNYIGMSEMGYCPCVTYFSFTKEEITFPLNVMKSFVIGSYCHNILADELLKRKDNFPNLQVEKELEISVGRYSLKGHADVVFEDYVIDWKFYGSSSFNFIRTPHQKYVDQLNLYLHATGREKAVLWYIKTDSFLCNKKKITESLISNMLNKQVEITSDQKVFLVKKQNDRCDYLLKKFVAINKALEKNDISLLVPFVEEVEEEECKSCQYRRFCSLCKAKKEEVSTEDVSDIVMEKIDLLKEKLLESQMLKQEIDELKSEIEKFLDKKGFVDNEISIQYIMPSSVKVLDEDKVLNYLRETNKNIEEFYKVKERNPFYKYLLK